MRVFKTCLLFQFLLIPVFGQQIEAFEEIDGKLIVEAEHFQSQAQQQTRKWHLIDSGYDNLIQPDDKPHFYSASGEAYLEVLPDTRTNHDEKLIHGVNFSNEPGKIATLNYLVFINSPGKYFVWVRAFSTGTEDNGMHVGLDGVWVDSGQRMQWCDGKDQWTWASKQRTTDVHCGVEKLIYLEIKEVGVHTISFSMREDGFEFDKWILDQSYNEPVSTGPDESSSKLVDNP